MSTVLIGLISSVLALMPRGSAQLLGPTEAISLQAQISELYRAGRYAEAVPLAQHVLDIYEKASQPLGIARSLNNLAALHEALGAYEQALPRYQRALEIIKRVRGNEHADTALNLSNLAMLYVDMAAYDQALPLLQEALRVNEKVLDDLGTAVTLNNLAGLYFAMGAYDQTLQLLQRALEICKKTGRSFEVATTLNNLAGLYYSMGAYDQSLSLGKQAVQMRLETLGAEHPDTLDSFSNLGLVYLARQDYTEADEYLRRGKSNTGLVELLLARGRAAEALQRLDDRQPSVKDAPNYHIEYFTLRGLALARLGRQADASVSLLKAVEGIEALRQRTPGDRASFFRAGAFGGYLRAYRALVAILAERAVAASDASARAPAAAPPYPMDTAFAAYGGDIASAAFSLAESTKARSLLEAMAGAARKENHSDLPEAIRNTEASFKNRLAALDNQWEQTYQRGPKAWQAYQVQRAELTLELEDLIQRLRRDYPLYAALHYPRSILARDVPLQDGEVLLEYSMGEQASSLFVLRRGGISRIVRIPLGRSALEAVVKRFMQPLLNARGQGFSTKQAAEVYSMLLAPAGLLETERLIVVPDGLLGLLPFEALVVEERTNERDALFVGDRHLVSYSHSATVLALLRTLKKPTGRRALFALGNPVFQATDPRYVAFRTGVPAASATARSPDYGFRGFATRREWGKTGPDDKEGRDVFFPPLPETEQEVRTLAGILGVSPEPPDVLLGVAANETQLKKAPLSEYRYLHFATHADLPGKVQGVQEPFLVLSQVENRGTDDGLMTLHEVLDLKLASELVVLSACVTGRGEVMDGEGVVNFARAFEHAGARSVVVSLWEVASLPAVEYMAAFYQQLHAGQPRLEALRRARATVRAKYANPYYWAVFVLHGEG